MKFFCEIAVKISKHLLWLSVLTLSWTDSKQRHIKPGVRAEREGALGLQRWPSAR